MLICFPASLDRLNLHHSLCLCLVRSDCWIDLPSTWGGSQLKAWLSQCLPDLAPLESKVNQRIKSRGHQAELKFKLRFTCVCGHATQGFWPFSDHESFWTFLNSSVVCELLKLNTPLMSYGMQLAHCTGSLLSFSGHLCSECLLELSQLMWCSSLIQAYSVTKHENILCLLLQCLNLESWKVSAGLSVFCLTQ